MVQVYLLRNKLAFLSRASQTENAMQVTNLINLFVQLPNAIEFDDLVSKECLNTKYCNSYFGDIICWCEYFNGTFLTFVLYKCCKLEYY